MRRVFCFRLLSIIVLAGLVGAVYPAAAVPLSDAPSFGPITFSRDFDRQTQTPIGPEYWFDAATVSLYVSFAYAGVTPGTAFQGTWYLDGEPFTERSGTFAKTSGIMGNNIGTADDLPLPEGTYGFGFEVAGEPVLYAECVVGGSSVPVPSGDDEGGLPTFGEVSVTDEFDEELGEPVGSARQFAYGVSVLYFYCSFADVPLGAYGITTAYRDQEFLYQTDTVFDFADGVWWETVENPDGSPLAPGNYSVIFEVDGRPSAMGDCIVGSAMPATVLPSPVPVTPTLRPVRRVTPQPARGDPALSALTFGLDVTDDGTVVAAANVFPAGTTTVWAYFTYTGMRDGMSWGRRWEENGELFAEALDLTWEYGEEGWLAVQITDDPAALAGDYTLTLFVAGAVARDGSFTVATGDTSVVPTLAPDPAVSVTPTPVAWQGGVGPEEKPQPAPDSVPTFAAMQFTTAFDAATGRPTGSALAFKPGIDRFYVYAGWQGARPDTTVLIAGTYYNPLTGEESLIYLNEGTLLAESGTWWEEIYDIQRESSLLPGLYRITVSSGAVDLIRGQIMISPDPEAAMQFYSSEVLTAPETNRMPESPAAPTRTVEATGVSDVAAGPVAFSDTFDWDKLELGDAATNFPVGTVEVYARFAYEGFPTSAMRWSSTTVSSPELGEDVFVCDHSSASLSESGTWTEIVAMHDGSTLPAGEYRIEFSILDGGGSRLVQVGTFTVGGAR